jgi:hypothetical protein
MKRTPSLVKGSFYEISHRDRVRRAKYSGYDSVGKHQIFQCEGREMRLDRKATSSVKRLRTTKSDTTRTYLYVCSLGGGVYKIGASCDPERRRKQIRTYAQKATMVAVVPLPRERGRHFRSYESAVLGRFAAERVQGGTEVLRLSPQRLADCVRAVRSECAR